jgi:phage terminase large subunit-like protein
VAARRHADAFTGGPHFEAFCAKYIRHTRGRREWTGQPLILEPWQRAFWNEALELDPVSGLRIYTEIGLGLPRKNGKSTMASASGLYGLVADGEPEPEVYVAAAAKGQAGIVMGQARGMANASPRLLDHVRVYRYHIECPRNGGIMRSLSSDAAVQHGLNPSWNIVDELHAHESPELYTALTTGTGARDQPLTEWISTAGIAGDGILASLYESIFDGPGQLEERDSLLIYRDRTNGTLIYWYGAPRDADIENPKVWLSCNPASWLQDGRWLSREFARLRSRGAELEWRRYHLNQFVGIEQSWLPPGAWERCRDERDPNGNVRHPLNPNLPIGVGIDKGQTSDLSAIVVAQRQGELVVVRATVFPPDPATGKVNSEAMRRHLRQLRTTYSLPMVRDPETKRPVQGPAFAFDRWSFSESADTLEQDGLNMVDFPQTAQYLAPVTGTAYDLINDARVVHDGDPMLAEHIANSTAVLTERGMKISKPRRMTPRKNDAAVAMVMAIAMAMQEAPRPSQRKPRTAVGF